MRVLVHLGLNKCASTSIQHALDRARPAMADAGCWYPVGDGPPCQYGVSRHYGFGPDAPEIAARTVEAVVSEARAEGCDRLILSSEYLSLYRPKAAEQFTAALAGAGCRADYLLFSRDVAGWIGSLFNQYVRTVEGGRHLPDIDAFVDQVLGNRAVDVAARVGLWSGLVGASLTHYRMHPGADPARVLAPFAAFAGTAITTAAAANESVGTDALHRVGTLRRRIRTGAEEREMQRLLAGGRTHAKAPEGYATIGPDRMARLEREIISPYRDLPVEALPEALDSRTALPKARHGKHVEGASGISDRLAGVLLAAKRHVPERFVEL